MYIDETALARDKDLSKISFLNTRWPHNTTLSHS